MIDVSPYLFKLEVLRRYLESVIDGELLIYTPYIFDGPSVIMTDKSGVVEHIPFDEYFIFVDSLYEPIKK